LCTSCKHNLPFTDHHEYRENEFEQHFWGRVPLQFGGALLTFSREHGVRDILHRMKYRDDHALAREMGRLMAIYYKKHYQNIDLIIPVPLHRDKKQLRGYNQCDDLVNGIQEIINIPIQRNILIRSESTETQTHKSRVDRAENMLKAFQVNATDDYQNKHILLIDDVMTTGATLEGCAQALLRAAPCTLSMTTLAMGDF